MRVLIILPGALGDVVRGLPLLGRIRAGLPDAEIGWSVEPLSAPLLTGHPWLDRLHVFSRREGLRGMWRHVRELQAAAYDVTIDLGRGIKSASIALGTRAPRRLGFARADAREGSWLAATEHLAPQGLDCPKLEQFWRFGDLLDLPEMPIAFGIATTGDEQAWAAAALPDDGAPLAAASLGSSCPSRRWFPDRTARTLDRLHERCGTRAVLLGTGADQAAASAVQAAMRTAVLSLVGNTSLRQLLAVLERAAVVIGPDSGALHLAAALGRPVVSLWGATSHLRSVPHGSEHLAVVGASSCAPCFLEVCPIGRVCMQAITVDAVLAHAERGLER